MLRAVHRRAYPGASVESRPMFLARWQRRLTAWIALCAVLLGALAPTLAQAALAAQDKAPGHWVQVCNASGVSWVRVETAPAGQVVDASEAATQVDLGHRSDGALHCPWCTLQGDAAGLPPADLAWQPEATARAEPPARAQRALRAPDVGPAQPRAPPVGV